MVNSIVLEEAINISQSIEDFNIEDKNDLQPLDPENRSNLSESTTKIISLVKQNISLVNLFVKKPYLKPYSL